MSDPLGVRTTAIDGLLVVDLVVHGDARGWFKENWRRDRMVPLGLPDFRPVQQNVSYNAEAGVTRGIHAEPWNKLVSVATGRIHGAWVDLREGPGFGRTVELELGPETAVFVPRGVGNAYQTLEPATTYAYLVDDHWSADAAYTHLALGDETAGIAWPIPLDASIRSEKDLAHPRLGALTPIPPQPALILGAGGQLGSALRAAFPEARLLRRDDCDVSDPRQLDRIRWRDHGLIVNAAAYTAVDAAETAEGRAAAWATNATAVAAIAERCREADVPLVHVSTDYVFDGTRTLHDEDEPPSPLSVYGASKAAGDVAAAGLARHWIVRTSWVVGDGPNFVGTMARLAAEGASPSVVADQFGRLGFAAEIARGIRHLVDTAAPHGTYNLTASGDVVAWSDIARAVFAELGADPARVRDVTTAEWARERVVAPRPARSALDLGKIEGTGFSPADWRLGLRAYLGSMGGSGHGADRR